MYKFRKYATARFLLHVSNFSCLPPPIGKNRWTIVQNLAGNGNHHQTPLQDTLGLFCQRQSLIMSIVLRYLHYLGILVTQSRFMNVVFLIQPHSIGFCNEQISLLSMHNIKKKKHFIYLQSLWYIFWCTICQYLLVFVNIVYHLTTYKYLR